ncbi:complement C1q tumor necrosis factor-related protein 3-like isoform 2-T2 [Odontesthes bonariensis]|uniref:complement C1q tumor necrosis factor-related protein 3-like n=1 Tax=Odontesthes bonariensis TaxID=219752 RepID=UPI003F585167
MRAIVLLSLLHAVFGQKMDFSWNGPVQIMPSADPNPGPGTACPTDQAACGCCVMQTQLNRMEQFFNFTVDELSKRLMESKMELNNMRASRSAFSVALNNDKSLSCQNTLNSNRVIIYKHVFINLGDGYNVQTGIFTVPRSGVYSLTITIYVSGLSGSTQVTCANLLVNGKTVATLFEKIGQDNEDSNSAVAAVQLQAGDQVAVSLLEGSVICDNNNHYNTFTGFLLFATD